MPAFALAQLHVEELHEEVIEYIERIQETLDPFQGRFRVHGGLAEVVEPGWTGDLVLIEFPSMAQARAWYASEAYQEILPLRTRHIRGTALLVEGVPAEGYHPREKAEQLRAAVAGE